MPSVSQVAPVGPFACFRLTTDEALVEVLPARGGLVSRFAAGDDELLFLDPATVTEPDRNVRGGIPVLWPIAGRLPGDAFVEDGRSYSMKQHGFARQLPWELVSTGADETGARVSMRLQDSEATRAQFPWRFEARLELLLQHAQLTVTLEVENRDVRELRHQPGFHPYFRVPDASKERAQVMTDATWALDNRTGKPVALGTPDFTVDELDWHLQDHGLPGTLLRRPPLRPVRLEWGDGFDTLVLWTQKGRDFVCVEPWAGPAGALASGEGVRRVAPGAVDRLWWALSV